MITCTKEHSSEKSGCGKCNGSGASFGNPRTDLSFGNKIDIDYHNFLSILEDVIYLNMVEDIPLDPMHLVDQGAMKRILRFLLSTKKTYRVPQVTLNPESISSIDCYLKFYENLNLEKILLKLLEH